MMMKMDKNTVYIIEECNRKEIPVSRLFVVYDNPKKYSYLIVMTNNKCIPEIPAPKITNRDTIVMVDAVRTSYPIISMGRVCYNFWEYIFTQEIANIVELEIKKIPSNDGCCIGCCAKVIVERAKHVLTVILPLIPCKIMARNAALALNAIQGIGTDGSVAQGALWEELRLQASLDNRCVSSRVKQRSAPIAIGGPARVVEKTIPVAQAPVVKPIAVPVVKSIPNRVLKPHTPVLEKGRCTCGVCLNENTVMLRLAADYREIIDDLNYDYPASDLCAYCHEHGRISVITDDDWLTFKCNGASSWVSV